MARYHPRVKPPTANHVTADKFKTLDLACKESETGHTDTKAVLVVVDPQDCDQAVTKTQNGLKKFRIIGHDHIGRRIFATFWNGDAEKVRQERPIKYS